VRTVNASFRFFRQHIVSVSDAVNRQHIVSSSGGSAGSPDGWGDQKMELDLPAW
jgi:hypothetical protein